MHSNDSNRRPSYEQISERARALWENRGRPEGQDDAIWLDAERELQADASPVTEDTDTAGAANRADPASTKGSSRRGQRRDFDGSRTLSRESSFGMAPREPGAYPDA